MVVAGCSTGMFTVSAVQGEREKTPLKMTGVLLVSKACKEAWKHAGSAIIRYSASLEAGLGVMLGSP